MMILNNIFVMCDWNYSRAHQTLFNIIQGREDRLAAAATTAVPTLFLLVGMDFTHYNTTTGIILAAAAAKRRVVRIFHRLRRHCSSSSSLSLSLFLSLSSYQSVFGTIRHRSFSSSSSSIFIANHRSSRIITQQRHRHTEQNETYLYKNDDTSNWQQLTIRIDFNFR